MQLPAGLPLQATTKDGRVGVFTTERVLTLLPAETKEVLLTRGQRRVELVIKVRLAPPLLEGHHAVLLRAEARRLPRLARVGTTRSSAISLVRAPSRTTSASYPAGSSSGRERAIRPGPEDEAGELDLLVDSFILSAPGAGAVLARERARGSGRVERSLHSPRARRRFFPRNSG